jgi:hypothetical protein
MKKKYRKECPACEKPAAIYTFMNNFREISTAEIPGITEKKLPTAEFLWDEAYSGFRAVKELEKKALRPLMVTRLLSYIFAIVVPLFLILSYLPEIKGIIHTNPEAHIIINSLSSILNRFIESFSFLLVPAAVCLLTLIIFIFITGFQPKKT